MNTSLQYTLHVENNDELDAGYYRVIDVDFHTHFRRAYYATVSWIDEELGRSLDGLEYFGFAVNTVVGFLGDHGFNLGELGLWNKHTLFELSVNVPLIFCVPSLKEYNGMSSDVLVELINIYPTLLDAVGLPPNQANEGKSILNFINDDDDTKRENVYAFQKKKVNFSQIAWGQIQANYTAYNRIRTVYVN